MFRVSMNSQRQVNAVQISSRLSIYAIDIVFFLIICSASYLGDYFKVRGVIQCKSYKIEFDKYFFFFNLKICDYR